MAAENRTATDRLSASGWTARLLEAPWAFDFFQALRRIEAAHPELPRLGEAQRPRDEPVRMGQEPSL
ncbi:MAG: type VI secretion system baseplate subunit TssG, partial [Burkholderiales bacterium]